MQEFNDLDSFYERHASEIDNTDPVVTPTNYAEILVNLVSLSSIGNGEFPRVSVKCLHLMNCSLLKSALSVRVGDGTGKEDNVKVKKGPCFLFAQVR